jgi:protein O-mannosyl-transferase
MSRRRKKIAQRDKSVGLLRPWPGIAGWLRSSSARDYFFSLILIAVTLFAYQPAWYGKPIMDDTSHLITWDLRPVGGLARIWVDPKTTQQYHPLVDTLFWVEDKLWGESMLGYHIVNILLHGVSALLLLKILRRLAIPGAWLATAIFALHPVQVESVAFLVELKNTLSALFFFGAILAYLRFDENRSKASFSLVLFLFCAGLLAKTIVAMLPATILIILWWKRGKLEWKRDVRPLLPFFILGIAAAVCTGWMEREFSGAKGEGFEFSTIDRVLIAGRAFWFYLGKILWPSNLSLIYPRWNVSAAVWWQYLFPIAALILFAMVWALRRRWLLSGLLFFALTLFPILGFFNVRLFTFSFAADHFQYLPIIGIVTPLSAGVAVLLGRLRGWEQTVGSAFCLIVVGVLTILTWQHSHMFQDSETCYRMVLERNPDAWAAHNNLGHCLLQKGLVDEASAHFQKVLELDPNDSSARVGARVNLGNALNVEGRLDESIGQFETALQIRPDARAYNGLGSALRQKGRLNEAIASYEKALEMAPRSALICQNLALILATCPDPSLRDGPKAVELAERADRLSGGGDPGVVHALAAAYAQTGQFSKAVATARRALGLATDEGETSLADLLREEIGGYQAAAFSRETTK